MALSLPRDDTTPLAVGELLAVVAVALEMHLTRLLSETTPEQRC